MSQYIDNSGGEIAEIVCGECGGALAVDDHRLWCGYCSEYVASVTWAYGYGPDDSAVAWGEAID